MTIMFLYIDPLKQGLKHIIELFKFKEYVKFLYIDPLKQGLKHAEFLQSEEARIIVFIHRSIKTRIETYTFFIFRKKVPMFLYIDPLKQGLKLPAPSEQNQYYGVFIHRSIKTRIETVINILSPYVRFQVFIHRSIKTRIETPML